MKAKELKDKAFCEGFYENNEYVNLYVFTEEEMAIFWSQICKEQREICEEYFFDEVDMQNERWANITAMSIRNAPEPEIQ